MRNGSLLSGHVVSLNAVHSHSVGTVGGKASQLAILKQLGLNVAPAVVVLAVAHDYANAAPDSIPCRQYAPDVAALAGESLPTRLRIQKLTRKIVAEYGDASILKSSVCAELIGGTERITRHLEYDVDIEWGATSQDQLFWLQCRPLTA